MEPQNQNQPVNIPHWVEARLRIGQSRCARTWQATLPNGRPVLAFRLADESALTLSEGQWVLARLSVADFSQAHVLHALEEASPATAGDLAG